MMKNLDKDLVTAGKILLVLFIIFVIIPRLWTWYADKAWTYASNPLLLETNEIIRDYLFELTPIGTSMEDVLMVIENNNEWEIHTVNERGAWHPYTQERIGEKSIHAVIGYSRRPHGIFVFVTHTIVFWGFDKDLYLVDIFVWGEIDGL